MVVAAYEDGRTADVTESGGLAATDPTIAALEAGSRLRPLADGTTTLRAAFGGLTAEATVAVAGAAVIPPRSFMLDVEPVLMRAGCNAGACHGSAKGKNGFRLSLFGFDPAMDHLHLTRQTLARRLTTSEPEASLLLLKATTTVAHQGGVRFDAASPYYRSLREWIDEGAAFDGETAPDLTGLEILPSQMVLIGAGEGRPGDRQRLIVRAQYADGSDRDVTDLALLASLNDNALDVDAEGVAQAKARGEASIIARFRTMAVVAQAIVLPPEEGFPWPETAPTGEIDRLIDAKLRRLRMVPSSPAADEIFVRRLYLDVIGLLPTPAELRRFMEDPAPDKRARLIEELLGRPEFPELWAMKWSELLRVEAASQRISPKAMHLYNAWLRDQIRRDVPIDEMTRALLTAEGGNFANPAANFYVGERDPNTLAENVAQVFTGIRLQCAQCHNHPFERWTMDDYYSFSAFFAQIGNKAAEDPRETIVFNSGSGEARHVRDGRPMAPRLLGERTPADVAGRDRRQVLAAWLTSPENPWFARTFANRVWEHFLGQGIIDPADDVRVSNPPANPELLDYLAARFVASRYDLRGLVREICNSRTYQASTATHPTNAEDLRNFSHRLPRRLSAERLLDAICQVTETPEKFPGLPLGARATQIADGPSGNYFLGIFGRPSRASVCTCERRDEPTLSQALHLINGQTINARVRSDRGRLARLLGEGRTPSEIVEEIYLAAYARPPREEERARVESFLAGAGDARAGLEDVFWSVLNSKEFVFYH